MHFDAFWCILMHIDAFWALGTKYPIFAWKIVNFTNLYVIKTTCLIILCTKHLHSSFCLHFDALWCILMHFDAFWCILMHFDALWCILTHIDSIWAEFWCISENASKCIGVHQNASACIKMHQMFVEWIVQMLCAQIEQRSGFYFI